MEITRMNNAKKVMFDQVDQGSIISYVENVYIKIPCVQQVIGIDQHTCNVNAVNLETGALRYIPPEMLILLVEDYEFKYTL